MRTTYSYCCEDILELIDEGDKRRVVDVDSIEAPVSTLGCFLGFPREAAGIGTNTYAVGLADAMATIRGQLRSAL